jgi:integrase/recombinase XerD
MIDHHRQRRCSRLSLTFKEWPDELARLWTERMPPGDTFSEDAPPQWAPATVECLRRAVARFLGYVRRSDPHRLNDVARAALEPATLQGFVAELRLTCRETSVSSYLLRLAIALRRLYPATDYALIFIAARRIGFKAPRLRHPIIFSKKLHQLALDGLAVVSGVPRALRSARRFRTLMLIGILSEVPMRVGSLSKIELSDLTEVGKCWQIYLRSEWAKGGKSAHYELSESMSRYLDVYLSDIRPIFPDPSTSAALWPSPSRGSLSITSIERMIGDYTAKNLGIRVTPHGFRRAAGAYIAYRDPLNVLSVRDLLNHQDFRTTETHYLPAARTRSAGRVFAAILDVPMPMKHISDAR